MVMLKKSITELINTDYKTYSMYVLENRAIPSAIDGLKPVQRKLLYSMIKNGGVNKKIKIAELGGGLSSYNYLHGESSAQQAAVGMAQDWCNNAPLFEGHGNFGSRIVPHAAAPRYIYASLSKNYEKYFMDEEVTDARTDLDDPEPQHYLPIIPWVLVNGVKGIAVGFATDIIPRDPKKLAKACLATIQGKSYDPMLLAPCFPHFKGTVSFVSGSSWKTTGIVTPDKNKFIITEVPIGYDRESYVTFLTKLVDDNKINDFEDHCSEEGFKFEVFVSRAQKQEIESNPIGFFKLEKQFSENITTIGHDGKVKLFDSAADLIKYFVEYRLKKTQEKIDYEKKFWSNKVHFTECKARFIEHIIDSHVDFRKLTKDQLIAYIVNELIVPEEFAKKFINIPLYECTVNAVQELEALLRNQKLTLESWEKSDPKKLYESRLLLI